MYDSAVAHVDGYVAGVEKKVAGKCLVEGVDGVAGTSLAGTRELYIKVGVDALNETGAVGAVGEAGAAVNVRVAYELESIVYNLLTEGTVGVDCGCGRFAGSCVPGCFFFLSFDGCESSFFGFFTGLFFRSFSGSFFFDGFGFHKFGVEVYILKGDVAGFIVICYFRKAVFFVRYYEFIAS